MRWFSLTLTHCYLIHVCLLFWISIPELEEWLIRCRRGLSHYRKRVEAGTHTQPDALPIPSLLPNPHALWKPRTSECGASVWLRSSNDAQGLQDSAVLSALFLDTSTVMSRMGSLTFLELFKCNFKLWMRCQALRETKRARTILEAFWGNWKAERTHCNNCG